jgi:xylulokinase
MTENYLLGIDLGTTNVKAIIMDENGNVITSASRQNELIFPGSSMVEQDANLWWKNTIEILSDVTKKAGHDIVKRIRGISVSSQTVTLLPLDKAGNPLRNAIIWMDSRSAPELQYIIDTIGYKHYVSIIGAQPDSVFLPNKILWYRKNEPELFNKTHRIVQASSYINYKLTGKITMDMDQASRTQCLDINTLKWSDEVSRAIGADINSLLPQPQNVMDIIGSVTSEAAALTGLVSGIPVIAGASDALASMYAMGLGRLGESGESSGTSSLVFVGHDTPSATDIPVVTRPCPVSGMPYIFDAPLSTSGAALKWYLDTLGKAEKDFANEHNLDVYEYMKQLAMESCAGSKGLMFFPYLMGERAPLWNSYARGMFIGLSLDTERKEIIRSVLEGTAFALRHVISTIKETGAKVDSLRITGGGSKNRIWSQIKASMLNIPVHILDDRSGDVPFGDTLIAGQAVGVFSDITKSMEKLVTVKEVIQPIKEWTDVYDQMYPLYINMYKHLDSDLKQLKETVSKLK